MDNDGVLVVQDASNVLVLDCADILLQFAPHDHDLPLAAILGYAAELAAPIAASLQEHRLTLAFEKHFLIVFNNL